MKVIETKNTISGQPVAAPVEGVAVAAPTAHAVDKISTDDAQQLQASVGVAISAASGERAMRLQSLAQQVRSGTYAPNVAQLAEEILAQAELDARLAQNLH